MDNFSDSVFTMLQLQRALNDHEDADWFSKQPLFLRAATLSAASAMQHFGYRLWGNVEPMLPEVRHDMDNILGYLLAHAIARKGRRDEELYRVAKEIEALYKKCARKDAHFGMGFLEKMEVLAARAASRDDAAAWAALFSAITDIGLDWNGYCRSYLSENILKLFRLDYGRDSKTYTETWGDKQDYVHLEEIISEMAALDLSTIRHALVMRYSVLAGRRATDHAEQPKQ
jgi:hypothetical protein